LIAATSARATTPTSAIRILLIELLLSGSPDVCVGCSREGGKAASGSRLKPSTGSYGGVGGRNAALRPAPGSAELLERGVVEHQPPLGGIVGEADGDDAAGLDARDHARRARRGARGRHAGALRARRRPRRASRGGRCRRSRATAGRRAGRPRSGAARRSSTTTTAAAGRGRRARPGARRGTATGGCTSGRRTASATTRAGA